MKDGLTGKRARTRLNVMPDYSRSRRIDPEGWPRDVPAWERRNPMRREKLPETAPRYGVVIVAFLVALTLIGLIAML